MNRSKIKYFYTHAGLFHTDEILAYVIISLAGLELELVRLTSLEDLPDDGLLADIGRKYNSKLFQYDHHQGFLTREDGYPYATAGLIWKHYGLEAVENCLQLSDYPDTTDFLQQVVQQVDDKFIKGIDAHDADSK